MSQPAINIDSLSADEQLDLLDRLWDRLSEHPERLAVTEAQRTELDRRLGDLDRDVREGRDLGIPWDEVLKQIRTR